MADNLLAFRFEVLHISVVDEAVRLGDGLDRQAGDFRDSRIEGLGGFALGRRTRERRQIIGQSKMLGLGKRLFAEGSLALELGGRERWQLQGGAECEALAAELKCALKSRRQHQDTGGKNALL